jgi:hypothetical protein
MNGTDEKSCDNIICEEQGFVQVIDESGEYYLFSSDYFVAVPLPKVIHDAMMRDAP